jgi:hypothetical protein
MDILKYIKKDYAKVKSLFKRLETKAERPGEEADALVAELVAEFLLHTKAKEKALYRPIRARSEKLRDFTLRAHVKQKLLEIALKRLTVVSPGPDGKFRAVLRVAREHFREHSGQEEKLFPAFEKAFSAEERELLSARYREIKEELSAKKEGATEVEIPATSDQLVRAEGSNEEDNPTVMDLSAPYAEATDTSEDIGDRNAPGAIGPEGVIQAIRPEDRSSPGAAGAIPSRNPELVPSAVVPAPSAGISEEQAPDEAPRSEQLKRAV